MGIRLRFGDDLGWGYHDDVTGGPPPLHFTPVGDPAVVWFPVPKPGLFPTPALAPAPAADPTPVGRDPSDPSTWTARPTCWSAGMIARLNGSGQL
jgi:hypothetical protein